MRLIVTAIALTALALPAAAQRLDTRVREVGTTNGDVKCRLNANPDMDVIPGGNGSPTMATLFQRPVESDTWLPVKLGFIIEPGKTGRFGLTTRLFSFSMLDMRLLPATPPVKVRMLLDGVDSGVPFNVYSDNPREVFVEVPEKAGTKAGERILGARWIDIELTYRDNRTRVYRFDGLRIADSAEIVSIIKFRCDGARAD